MSGMTIRREVAIPRSSRYFAGSVDDECGNVDFAESFAGGRFDHSRLALGAGLRPLIETAIHVESQVPDVGRKVGAAAVGTGNQVLGLCLGVPVEFAGVDGRHLAGSVLSEPFDSDRVVDSFSVAGHHRLWPHVARQSGCRQYQRPGAVGSGQGGVESYPASVGASHQHCRSDLQGIEERQQILVVGEVTDGVRGFAVSRQS